MCRVTRAMRLPLNTVWFRRRGARNAALNGVAAAAARRRGAAGLGGGGGGEAAAAFVVIKDITELIFE